MDMERVLRLMPRCVFCFRPKESPGNEQQKRGQRNEDKNKNQMQTVRRAVYAARQKERGRIETGFKQCLCDNRDQFEIVEDGGTSWIQMN